MFFRPFHSRLTTELPGLLVTEHGRFMWLRYFGLPAAASYLRRNWMTWIAAFAIAILFSYSGPSGATGVKEPAEPTPAPASISKAGAGANAAAQAAGQAEAAAQANQGQQQGQSMNQGQKAIGKGGNASAEGGSVSNGPITVQGDSVQGSTSRAYAIGFPPPVYASSAAINGCTIAGNEPIAAGWNFISHSPMKVFAERTCVMLTLARDAWETCQFASATTIRQLLAEELLDEKTRLRLPVLNVAEKNLTAEECHTLKRPATAAVQQPQQQPTLQVLIEGAQASALAIDNTPPRAPARAPKGKPASPCPEGQKSVQQCVPVK